MLRLRPAYDLTFDINTALFFATHRFTMTGGIATFDRVPRGAHTGVIYCFRFGSPAVKEVRILCSYIYLRLTDRRGSSVNIARSP